MSRLHRLTALAIARAMLAGAPTADGLAARMRACLDADPPWITPLAQRCARLPGEQWRRLAPRPLADLIERDPGYQAAWARPDPPQARRYLLHRPHRLQPLPVGLEDCPRPDWPHLAALAAGLGLSDGALWRLTLPAAWQRRRPLAEQHYRAHWIAKPAGGWRLLEVPHPYLMAIQRRLLDALLQHLPPHEAAFGYRAGRSIVDHARLHAGQPVLLRFDLQDFFGLVRGARVHALFETLGYPEEVARALAALCTAATPEPVLQRLRSDAGLPFLRAQRLRDAHLPQGAPTSPALANLCAFRLDLRLDGLARALGARYSRYADDLVLSGDGHLRGALPRIAAWVGRIALEEGFALNHRKTRCLSEARRQTVCGVVVNRHPNLPRAEFDRLKALLHRCVQRGPAAQNVDARPDWRAHLQGRVAWAAQLNPAKAQRLQRLFERIDWAR